MPKSSKGKKSKAAANRPVETGQQGEKLSETYVRKEVERAEKEAREIMADSPQESEIEETSRATEVAVKAAARKTRKPKVAIPDDYESDSDDSIYETTMASASKTHRSQDDNAIGLNNSTVINGKGHGFRGGTYALIQDQLKAIDAFDGDIRKQSFDMFEYKLNMALDLAQDIPDKMKLAMLRQKLTGAPAEFLRLDPLLRDYDFERLMSWLRTQYGDLHQTPKEERMWQDTDTPDSYYLRIKRGLEADLPTLPPKMIGKIDPSKEGEYVRDEETGLVVLEENPEYKKAIKERAEYYASSDKRLIRDYLDGLKPEFLAKMTKRPKSFEKLHLEVREMWDLEQRHPSKKSASVVKPSPGLQVFAANSQDPQAKSGKQEKGQQQEGLQLAYSDMAGINKTLIEAITKMTESNAVKPSARAGTARDPANPAPPNTANVKCFNCNQKGHYGRDCGLPDRRQNAPKEGGNGKGKGKGKGKKGKGGGQAPKGEGASKEEKKEKGEKPKAKPVDTEKLMANMAAIMDKLAGEWALSTTEAGSKN